MVKTLLLSLSILFSVLTLTGLYKPWIVFWWSDFSNRKKVLSRYGSLALFCWAAYLLTSSWPV